MQRNAESRFLTLPAEYRYRHDRPALHINWILAASPIESTVLLVERVLNRGVYILLNRVCTCALLMSAAWERQPVRSRATEEAHVRDTCARIKPTARDSIERDVDVTRYERTGISGKVTASVPSEATVARINLNELTAGGDWQILDCTENGTSRYVRIAIFIQLTWFGIRLKRKETIMKEWEEYNKLEVIGVIANEIFLCGITNSYVGIVNQESLQQFVYCWKVSLLIDTRDE